MQPESLSPAPRSLLPAPRPRIAWRFAGLAGLLWMGEQEKQLFANPLSYGELNGLHDANGVHCVEFWCRERPLTRESRIGYLITRRATSRIELIRVVVAERWRRRGYGREIVEWASVNGSGRMTPRLLAGVDEVETGIQQFFAACGFHAITLVQGSSRNVIQFERRMDGRAPTAFSVVSAG